MSRMGRYAVGLVLTVVCAGFGLRWILGPDNVGPFVNTAKLSVQQQFEKLVDEYALELEKAKSAVGKAEERALQVRLLKQKAMASVTTMNRELTLAQNDIAEAQKQLTGLHDKLQAGQSVRLVSGRVATKNELQTIVEDHTSRIQIAKEKVSYLEQITQRRQSRYEKLVNLDKESPAALQRLRNSVDFLARKVELYREVKNWVEEDAAGEVELNGLYAQAQRTLEDAHAKLDMKLAEVDAMLGMSLDVAAEPAPEHESTDGLLADIRTALADPGTIVEK